jgi:two-component system, OmpR family, copper resistance phosphate regulon response regulator CusR
MGHALHVLVVEDHPKVAESIQRGLGLEGFTVRTAATGDEGGALACAAQFDAVILDVMLPGRSGFDILADMRRQRIHTPVLLLTARDSLDDRVNGLNGGADDYLVKPFAFPELLARLRALLRRGRPHEAHRMTLGDLELDLIARRASRGGVNLDLAPREFELLAFLTSHAGDVVSREMLGRHVWQQLDHGTPLDNVIDVHMARLRRKVDHEFARKRIQTVRGLGFKIVTDDEP